MGVESRGTFCHCIKLSTIHWTEHIYFLYMHLPTTNSPKVGLEQRQKIMSVVLTINPLSPPKKDIDPLRRCIAMAADASYIDMHFLGLKPGS